MRCNLFIGGLLLALSTGAAAGQVYKWVDAQGITHYGSQPPEGQAAQSINTVTGALRAPQPQIQPSTEAPSASDEQARIDREVKAQVAQREAERNAYCEALRTNLAQLKNNPRVRIEENGQARKLTEEERQGRIGETEQKIGEHCN